MTLIIIFMAFGVCKHLIMNQSSSGIWMLHAFRCAGSVRYTTGHHLVAIATAGSWPSHGSLMCVSCIDSVFMLSAGDAHICMSRS